MAHHKLQLPKKNCAHCGLAFVWRKKWRKDWEQVKYCSERCRRSKMKPANTGSPFGQ
ncbi:MAG: DUF2256 domain-containing protein [Proteobacteria bacterium]|nr:DUF2256 domain-containing protein [Pseudomonadota bacterium]